MEKNGYLKNTEGRIGFYFDVTPFEQTQRNKEDKNSRLYYRHKETKGGIDIGLSGKVKKTVWGLPVDKIPVVGNKLKEYISAGLYVVGTAKVGGELKGVLRERKYVNSKKWVEVYKGVNPAIIKLGAEFGVGVEVKFLKPNYYLSFSGNADGTAKAEILSIGWVDDDFQFILLRNGVFIDAKATLSGTFLGKKLETTPYYKRIILIQPQKTDE